MPRLLSVPARSWDTLLVTLTGLLLAVGLAELYTSTLVRPELLSLMTRQLVAAGIGSLALIVAAGVDYRTYRSWSKLIYLTALALLVVVLLLGRTLRGTTGWLVFWGVTFQPVEAVKFLWVLALSSYLAHVGAPLTWRTTVTSGLLLAPLVALVLLQPDFGAAFILVVVWVALLMAVPKSKQWWLVMGTLALATVLVGGLFLKDYQQQRLATFLNPQADPLGAGYNVTQSVVAVGAGRWFGRGLGAGTQSQLRFLPEQQTDFVFASIAEELGFVGAVVVLALWLGFFWRLAWLMQRLRDDFGVLVAAGLFTVFGLQVALNVGMNLGLAPVVGVTLPFMSYGGSSLIASLAAVGVLQNLARNYGTYAPLGTEGPPLR